MFRVKNPISPHVLESAFRIIMVRSSNLKRGQFPNSPSSLLKFVMWLLQPSPLQISTNLVKSLSSKVRVMKLAFLIKSSSTSFERKSLVGESFNGLGWAYVV